jgi:hypothetical protein
MGVRGTADSIDSKEKKRLQWCGRPRQKDVGGENTKINCGMDTAGEKKKRTSKKNVNGRSKSSHDNKKFGTRSTLKRRGLAFGLWKTATTDTKPEI